MSNPTSPDHAAPDTRMIPWGQYRKWIVTLIGVLSTVANFGIITNPQVNMWLQLAIAVLTSVFVRQIGNDS